VTNVRKWRNWQTH